MVLRTSREAVRLRHEDNSGLVDEEGFYDAMGDMGGEAEGFDLGAAEEDEYVRLYADVVLFGGWVVAAAVAAEEQEGEDENARLDADGLGDHQDFDDGHGPENVAYEIAGDEVVNEPAREVDEFGQRADEREGSDETAGPVAAGGLVFEWPFAFSNSDEDVEDVGEWYGGYENARLVAGVPGDRPGLGYVPPLVGDDVVEDVGAPFLLHLASQDGDGPLL
jgi:hypothetical protein